MEAKTRSSPLPEGFWGRNPIAKALLQGMGLVGTSYWLHYAIQITPGFAESRLAALAPNPVTRWAEAADRFLREALLTGALEELFFRGLLFALFERMRGRRFALVASALLFGLAHLDPHHGFVAFLLGLQLGLIRIVHGLPMAAIAHIANNALALAIGGLAATSPSLYERGLSPGAAGLLGLALLGSFLACAELAQSARRQDAPPRHRGSAL